MQIKSTIADMRKARNISQQGLSEATGIHRVTIARYEAGKVKPTLPQAKKIADALDCTVDELLKKEEE